MGYDPKKGRRIELKSSRRRADRVRFYHTGERFLTQALRETRPYHTALALLLLADHRSTLSGQEWVTVPQHLLDDLGIDAAAKSRALKALAEKGLVRTQVQPGHSTRIKVLRRTGGRK